MNNEVNSSVHLELQVSFKKLNYKAFVLYTIYDPIMLKVTGALSFLALVAVCGATNRNGFLYPFDINSRLVCHNPNPFADLEGQPLSLPEVPPRVPFAHPIRVNDGFITGPPTVSLEYELWLPQASTFRMPSLRGLDENELLRFLGDDFNRQLTSVDLPSRPPPRACDLLPAFEGSAAQRRIHIEVVQEPVPLFDEITAMGRPVSLLYNQSTDEPGLLRRFGDFGGEDFERARVILNETNARDPLCDQWIAKCPLAPKWVNLPASFFPRFLAQSVCSGKNCSVPQGLTCQEDFSYTVHVTVLRWDCCYNHLNRETRWDCGWRKVQVPIFCDCTCSCNEVFHL